VQAACGVDMSGRMLLRWAIDTAALYVAFSIQLAASGSVAAAVITAVGVGLYGVWCFYDGTASP
jgi:hypothetical protein